MPETLRETTERVVTDDVPVQPPEPVQSPPSEGAEAPASTVAAVAAGMELGAIAGAAAAEAELATEQKAAAERELTEYKARAEAAERELNELRPRLEALLNPPAAETAETELVEVETPPATEVVEEPAPMRTRGLIGRIFLG